MAKIWAILPQISLSYIALPGEPIDKNTRRLFASLDIVDETRPLSFINTYSITPLVFIHTPGHEKPIEDLVKKISGQDPRMGRVNIALGLCSPMGRATQLDAKYLQTKGNRPTLATSFFNIRSNGDVCWVNLEGKNYEHYLIGNALNGPKHIARHRAVVEASRTHTPNRCR